MNEHALISLAGILVIGIMCQWVAWRVKMPAIIFLLLSGILAGPVLNFLHPDQLFGDLFFPFVSLSVAVILFEGSLTLKFQDIPGLERIIRNLISIGALVTWLGTALTTRLLLDFSWEVSFLFGAIMVVTGPTVIVPMLRTVRPNEHISSILRWEGILIDPIGATLAVLVYEFIAAGGAEGGFAAGVLVFGKTVSIGILLGASGGSLFGLMLRRHWIPQYLHNFAALSLVCAVYVLANTMVVESGLLSVTVMGIWLANMKNIELDEILDFKESLSVLLISALFIMLSARMNPGAFVELGWPALALFGSIQFFIRPLNAQLSALGSKLSMAERLMLSWVAPRGIVAAAVAALFAFKLESAGYQDASHMVPLTFLMIIGTVLLQSATARPIAGWLKVADPEPRGFLISGADMVARYIAKSLQENGFRVLLADQNRDNIAAANMEGLPAYWGNPVSEHADRHLSLIGIGRLLAMTSSIELNALAARHYRMEFGINNIYTIRNQSESGIAESKSAFKHSGRHLFDEAVTHQFLAQAIDGGAAVKTTPLTEEFSFESYVRLQDEKRLPLFAIDPHDHIHVFTSKPDFIPGANWKIIGLSIDRPPETDYSA